MNIDISRAIKPVEKELAGYVFYIRPFAAFVSSSVFTDILSIISPLAMSLLPALFDDDGDGEEKSLLDMDLEKAAPFVIKAFSSLSSDKMDKTLRALLIREKNIHVGEANGRSDDVSLLDYDTANAIFIGNIADMYLLAFEVIKINYGNFFEKLSTLSGSPGGLLRDLATRTSMAG